MSLDFRAILASLPGDSVQTAAFVKRYDDEGYTQALYDDVAAFLQRCIDADLDGMGAPSVDENDPELLEVAQKAANEAQKALDDLAAGMTGFQKRADALNRDVHGKLDAVDVEEIRDEIAKS